MSDRVDFRGVKPYLRSRWGTTDQTAGPVAGAKNQRPRRRLARAQRLSDYRLLPLLLATTTDHKEAPWARRCEVLGVGEAPGGVGGQGATLAGRRVGQCGRSDWTNPPVVAPR